MYLKELFELLDQHPAIACEFRSDPFLDDVISIRVYNTASGFIHGHLLPLKEIKNGCKVVKLIEDIIKEVEEEE